MNHHRPWPAAGGFTLPELVIGLLLLALIGGATAAVASAVTRGWQLGESSHTSNLTMTRAMLRLQDKVQRSKYLGECRAGSLSDATALTNAALLFWRDDVNGDGLMQLDETQLLDYDHGTKSLLVWELAYPDPVTRAANNGPFPRTILNGSTAISDYKTLAHVRHYAIAKQVLGAQFNLITPSSSLQRPVFEYRLKFNSANGQVVEYGTAVPRAPAPNP